MLPLTASADPRREIPGSLASRCDRIEAALATLAAEERRLSRLGLETPLARCHEQRRYWTFLRALYSLPTAERALRPSPGFIPGSGDGTR